MFKDMLTFLGLDYRYAPLITLYFVVQLKKFTSEFSFLGLGEPFSEPKQKQYRDRSMADYFMYNTFQMMIHIFCRSLLVVQTFGHST